MITFYDILCQPFFRIKVVIQKKKQLSPYLLDWHAEGLSGRIEWKTSCELWHLDTYKYQVKYGTGILVKCRTWTREM